MKKGISLIVLVITIIVMIIIAGAVIISLNSSDVIARAEEATLRSNVAELQSAVALEYANQYTAYLSYVTGNSTTAATKPTANSVSTNTVIADLLTKVNANTKGETYQISENTNGVYVEKVTTTNP